MVTPAGDSTKKKVHKLEEFNRFQSSNFMADTTYSSKVDSSLETFFYYSPQLYNFKTNTGINGGPQKNLIYGSPRNNNIGIDFDQLGDFRFNVDSNKYYDLSQPYARVSYINGAKKEEGIDIEFSQNIRELWNWGIQYKKTGGEGFYPRQKTSINNFRFFQSFRSKNNFYNLLGTFIYNETYVEENGGLQNDSLFEFSLIPLNRASLPLNLNNAKNTSRNYEYGINQKFNLGKKRLTYFVDENDSLYPDSIIAKWTQPQFTIEHSGQYKIAEYTFEDYSVDSSYYGNPLPFGNYNILDKTYTADLVNEVTFGWHKFNKISGLSDAYVKAGLGYQYLEYNQTPSFPAGPTLLNDKFYSNLYGLGTLETNPLKPHVFKASGKIFFNGYNNGDYQFEGITTHDIAKFNLKLNGHYRSNTPSLIYTSFQSTAYQWENTLNKEGELLIGGNVSIPHLNFSFGSNYRSVINHVYFDNTTSVQQFNNDINIFSAHIEQHFKVSIFHLNLKLQYQTMDKAGIINVPELLSYNSFYLETRLFQKEMLLRLGSDIYMTSSYFGDLYNPVIRQWTVQNQKEIGLFPIVDFFLLVNVDRAYFFVKLANALEGVTAYNYYASPNYPLPDRALKFGVKWEFLN